jgi:hypothetical protein
MSTPLPGSGGLWFRRFTLAYAVVSVALLGYFIVAWRGWFGVAPLSNPRTSLSLMTFLAFMGLTWVALPRSQLWATVFGSASVVAFVLYVAAIMAG